MRFMAIVVTVVLSLLFVSSLCLAAVPPMISYQGKLMQPTGVPVPDNTYSMTFAIYGAPTGGTALWSELNASVQVKGGLFSVLLGGVNNLPANLFDNENRWFGVTVGTDPEMAPRQRIVSVAFAQKAASADLATTVPNGAITAAKLAPGAVTVGSVADGTLTAAKLAPGVATPTGTISMFGGATAPTGWLICDGSAVSRTDHAALFAAIGTAYGTGDGSTTFNLPDMRGVFPKGVGTTTRSAGKDAIGNFYSGTLGQYLQDRLQGHYHGVSGAGIAEWYGGADDALFGPYQSRVTGNRVDILSPTSDGTNGGPRTGPTTEPQSLGVSFIIKI